MAALIRGIANMMIIEAFDSRFYAIPGSRFQPVISANFSLWAFEQAWRASLSFPATVHIRKSWMATDRTIAQWPTVGITQMCVSGPILAARCVDGSEHGLSRFTTLSPDYTRKSARICVTLSRSLGVGSYSTLQHGRVFTPYLFFF